MTSNFLQRNYSDNQIAKLPRSIFVRNSQLKTLNLARNQIKEIDSYLLKGVRFLRNFYMSGNQISEVAKNAFTSTTRMREIDLSNNSIVNVTSGTFNNLQWLDYVKLDHNQIEHVQTGAFQKMYRVLIDLSWNNISKIDKTAFRECQNISTLGGCWNPLIFKVQNYFDHFNNLNFPTQTSRTTD